MLGRKEADGRAAPPPRAATEEKLTRLLDATEEIMLRRGLRRGELPQRRRAGRDPGRRCVHYYFPTIDDLFVAVLRRRVGAQRRADDAALASAQPFRAWWDLASDPRGTALLLELLAAANHRPALRAEVGEVARGRCARCRCRRCRRSCAEYGLDPDDFPPALHRGDDAGAGVRAGRR